MADRARKTILPLARRCGLESLIRLSRQRTIFPFYHGISNTELDHIKYLYTQRTVAEFKRDLDQMTRYFEPVSLSDYLYGTGSPGGRRRMVLTFDDGLAECYSLIAPILKQKGIPAVFFLNNAFIGNRDLFFRYKVSLIIEAVLSDCRAMEKAAEFLAINQDQVVKALVMIKYNQRPLLDAIAADLEHDFAEYMKDQPVYMTDKEVSEVVEWGFEVGGHSPYHADFSMLDEEEILQQVDLSIRDLQVRFRIKTRYFSFPFTSAGIPERVIAKLFDTDCCSAIFGTAGIKKTRIPGYIQRIPMEVNSVPAIDLLKTEYFYYLLKAPVGRNRI